MNKDNPYIYEGLPGPLEGTVCNVYMSLGLLQRILLFEPTGEPGQTLTLDQDDCHGLQLMLAGMRGALGHVLEELSDYERKPTPDPGNISQLPQGA